MTLCKDCRVDLLNKYDHYCVNCRPKVAQRRRLKKKIHSLVNQAVKHNRITKPAQCEVCDKTANLQGHHADYNYVYDLIWCCDRCHKDIHKYCYVEPIRLQR